MISRFTWFCYFTHKLHYSYCKAYKSYFQGLITHEETRDAAWRNIFRGKMTYLLWNKGEEMAPAIAGQGRTLLVRKLPLPFVDLKIVEVGDVMVLEDPENEGNYLVRRLAAVEGDEMVSNDENDKPFVLGKGQCWVLADNSDLEPKDANDSRTFGPVSLTDDIVGRVLYCMTAEDHSRVKNSNFSMMYDTCVLKVELDVDAMRIFLERMT